MNKSFVTKIATFAALISAPLLFGAGCSSENQDANIKHIGKTQSASIVNCTNWNDCMLSLSPGAWYMMDDSSSTLYDYSGHALNGTYVGNKLPVSGKIGNATSFNYSTLYPTYAYVNDDDTFSLQKEWDYFGRTSIPASNWGVPQHAASYVSWYDPLQYVLRYHSTYNGVYGGGNIPQGTAQIDEYDSAARRYMQVMWGSNERNVDLQVAVKWSSPTINTNTWFVPGALVSHYTSTGNYYFAQIVQYVGSGNIQWCSLQTYKHVNGPNGTNIPLYNQSKSWTTFTCPSNNIYWLRMQTQDYVNSSGYNCTNISARAWQPGISSEPSDWSSASDCDSALNVNNGWGTNMVGLFSDNFWGTSRGSVSFYNFRTQSLGMTVSAWIQPGAANQYGHPEFIGNKSCLCNSNPKIPGCASPDHVANYVSFLNKTDPDTGSLPLRAEWATRFYPASAVGGGSPCTEDRSNRISGYMYGLPDMSIDDKGNISAGLGAGDDCQPDGISSSCNAPVCSTNIIGSSCTDYTQNIISEVNSGTWYYVTVVYDPGDSLDQMSGSHLYINGQPTDHCTSGLCEPTLKYNYSKYNITPGNSTAPLRIAALFDGSSGPEYFQGAVDEVAIFNRSLSDFEISRLYCSADGSQPGCHCFDTPHLSGCF